MTEINYKIYDVLSDDSWAYESFVFKWSEVEGLYGLENEISGDEERREKVLTFSLWGRNEEIDGEGVSFISYLLGFLADKLTICSR